MLLSFKHAQFQFSTFQTRHPSLGSIHVVLLQICIVSICTSTFRPLNAPPILGWVGLGGLIHVALFMHHIFTKCDTICQYAIVYPS